MIGELELEVAIETASATAAAGELVAYASAGIDVRPVSAYARRYAQVKEAAGADYAEAAAGGLMLGFRLGVLAARVERQEVVQ